MNAPRITGRQARKLLELPDNAASWKIEQRNLAETVAWLFGREPGRDGAHGIGLRTIRPTGGYVEMDGYEMRPETAVDLARALLTAAEEAWDGAARLAAIICAEAAARDEEDNQ